MSKSLSKVRVDSLLVSRGFFSDTDAAARAILAGEVKVCDRKDLKPGDKVMPDVDVSVASKKRFVSRGGEKLDFAIKHFGVDIQGANCLDIGSSTGGFSDCLLKAQAAHVTCVDVNYGQLAWEIRKNPRVSVYERTNIKLACPEDIDGPFDVVVIDVSFIGLSSLASKIASFIKPGGLLLALIKPQFESRKGETEGGVVYDEDVRLRVVDEVSSAMTSVGLTVIGVVASPVKGPAGNIEYLLECQRPA